MSDRGYYTPKNQHTPQFKTPLPYTPKQPNFDKQSSDSDESTSSTENAGTAGSSENGELTIVAEFDDLMRAVRQQRCDEIEDAFLEFAEQSKEMSIKWNQAVQECQRLQASLEKKTQECHDMEANLEHARSMLHRQMQMRKKTEHERDRLQEQVARIHELLLSDTRNQLVDETKQRLEMLGSLSSLGYDNKLAAPPQLSDIKEDMTGSLLSDFSYSRSEDDLDASQPQKGFKTYRPSLDHSHGPATKKRRSSEHHVVEINHTDAVRATTTLTVAKDGPITATSVIESFPGEAAKTPKSIKEHGKKEYRPSAPPAETASNTWQGTQNRKYNEGMPQSPFSRMHVFQTKNLLMPHMCTVCVERIGFGSSSVKCDTCRAICHRKCRDNLPLPCIPAVSTPTTSQGGALGRLEEYTPLTPPKVPALIIHCVNEIELRGFNEIGLYRVPGSEKDVKLLKEKFLKNKGAPCLNDVELPVLCGVVKDFLRSLREPLLTRAHWSDFVNAVEARDEQDIAPALYQTISELPQANRDTLAYMILHLKKVADSKECKMPIENLAKVFGPTIVGYSSDDPDSRTMYSETPQQAKVMEHLLKLPTDYWSSFINVVETQPPSQLRQTPSTDSLLLSSGRRGFFTPNTRTVKRKQRFFPTPPNLK